MSVRSDVLDVSVVIICHNYGRYLAEAITSVLMQTRPAKEIVVIDDASTDDTPEVAKVFADRGVRYHRVATGNVQENRRIGAEITEQAVLCFLDADDRLPVDYLSAGLPCFNDPHVAVVYSDMQSFGASDAYKKYPEQFDRELLQRVNYIHAASLVLRAALMDADAWNVRIELNSHDDWYMWRRVLRYYWQAVKQPALYQYREHEGSAKRLRLQKHVPPSNKCWREGAGNLAAQTYHEQHYFDLANLVAETITLFIPLSGRSEQWPSLAEFLEKQTWPHDQIQLVLMDTSQSDAFHETVRTWVSDCDYADVRLLRYVVGPPNLADHDRVQTQAQVRAAMRQMYCYLSSILVTPYCWILEDDIRPPVPEVCEQLLRSMGPHVALVSAPHRSRYQRAANFFNVVHDRSNRGKGRDRAGIGVVEVPATGGFGCVVVRRECLKQSVFVDVPDEATLRVIRPGWELDLAAGNQDYERAFFDHLIELAKERGPYVFRQIVKVDWDMECWHIGAPFYSVVKDWKTEEDWDSWKSLLGIRLSNLPNGVKIVGAGADPQMSVSVSAPAGWKRVVIVCKSAADVMAYFYWETTAGLGGKKPPESCRLEIEGNSVSSRHVAHFFTDDPLTALRFDPHVGPCEMVLESLSLEVVDELPVEKKDA